MLLRHVLTEDLCEYNYFIAPARGCMQRASRCFVASAELLPPTEVEKIWRKHPDKDDQFYKCNLFSSLN